MELLGYVGHMDSCFGPFGDYVCVSARYVHGLHQMYHRLRIVLDAHDGTPRYKAQVEARFSPFEDSANLDTRWMHGFGQTYRRLRNNFGCTRWNS
jgi:hypothetical protein